MKRKGLNAGKVTKSEHIIEIFLSDITAEVVMNDIPSELIFNWDKLLSVMVGIEIMLPYSSQSSFQVRMNFVPS